MHELVEIDSLLAHKCAAPQVLSIRGLKPVSGQWLRLTIFDCCGQLLSEPEDAAIDNADVQQAA